MLQVLSKSIRQSSQWNCEELLMIRNVLISKHGLEGLQTYCILLVSSYLFLPVDTTHKLLVNSIRKQDSLVTENGVVNFSVEVDRVQELVLWAVDDVPKLCPIRHLLAYVYLAKIEQGYLFPDLNSSVHEMRNPVRFLADLDDKLKKVWTGNITNHTCVKTGYLLALWGGGDLSLIQKCARHESLEVAKWFRGKANVLKKIAVTKGVFVEHSVGAFRPCVRTKEFPKPKMDKNTQTFFRSLAHLAHMFVTYVGGQYNLTKFDDVESILEATVYTSHDVQKHRPIEKPISAKAAKQQDSSDTEEDDFETRLKDQPATHKRKRSSSSVVNSPTTRAATHHNYVPPISKGAVHVPTSTSEKRRHTLFVGNANVQARQETSVSTHKRIKQTVPASTKRTTETRTTSPNKSTGVRSSKSLGSSHDVTMRSTPSSEIKASSKSKSSSKKSSSSSTKTSPSSKDKVKKSKKSSKTAEKSKVIAAPKEKSTKKRKESTTSTSTAMVASTCTSLSTISAPPTDTISHAHRLEQLIAALPASNRQEVMYLFANERILAQSQLATAMNALSVMLPTANPIVPPPSTLPPPALTNANFTAVNPPASTNEVSTSRKSSRSSVSPREETNKASASRKSSRSSVSSREETNKARKKNPTAPRQVYQNLDDLRLTMRKTTGRTRLELIVHASDRLPPVRNTLPARDTSWAYFAITPVMHCLKYHFRNNKDKFLQKHAMRDNPRSFRTHACSGKGTRCEV